MIRHYWKDRSGSVAIEFSFLALPFFTMMFAIIVVGYHALIQAELDRATTTIAQHISIFAHTDPTSRDYLGKGPCKDFVGPLIDCSELRLGAAEVKGRMVDYRSKVIGNSEWSLGCAGDTVIVELTYPFSSLLAPIAIADIVESEGNKFYRSRAVIRREPIFAGGATC